MIRIIRQTITEFIEDDCPRLAAALAYYTIFSLPAVVLFLVAVLSRLYDPSIVRGEIIQEMQLLLGTEGTAQVEMLVQKAGKDGNTAFSSLLGAIVLLVGATGAVAQLQAALNKVWEVAPDPRRSGLRRFLVKRLLSFALLIGVALLLLVSLMVNALLAGLGQRIEALIPVAIPALAWATLNNATAFFIIALLFAAIFKLLPDAKIAWRHVWVGAFLTSGMFTIGKYLIGIYLGRSNVGSAYGAAGALSVVLLWVYYSSMIVLLGAEFTQVWTHHREPRVEPEDSAMRTESPPQETADP